MKKDVEFFKQNSLIDYSILIGIHKVKDSNLDTSLKPKEEPSLLNRQGVSDVFDSRICWGKDLEQGSRGQNLQNGEIYFIGIIDVLTSFRYFFFKKGFGKKRVNF